MKSNKLIIIVFLIAMDPRGGWRGPWLPTPTKKKKVFEKMFAFKFVKKIF